MNPGDEESELQQFIQKIFDTNPNILYVFDLDERRAIYQNRHVAAALGYTEAEITGMTDDVLPQLSHPNDIAQIINHFTWMQTAADDEILDVEYRMRHKDGSWRWFYGRDTVFKRAPDGRVQQIIGTATDITERRQTEEALRQSELRYRSVVEDMPGLLCRFQPGGIVEFANEAYARTFGRKPEEMVGYSFLTHIPEANRAAVMAQIEALTPDSPVMTHEHPATVAGGEIRWHRWTNRLLTDEAGQTIAYQAFGEDITEQKQLTAERDAIFQRNQTLVQALGEIVYEWWPTQNFTEWSGDYERILGYSAAEMGNDTNSWAGRVHPDDLTPVLAKVNEADQEKRAYDHEYRFRRRDGAYNWMHDHGILFYNAQSELERIVGVFRDITQRKLAEEALRQSEAHLEEAQAQTRLGSWAFYPERQVGTWSKEMYRLFGRDTAAGSPSFEEFIAYIHPQDRATVVEAHQKTAQTGEASQIEFKTNPKYGPIRHLLGRVYSVQEEQTRHLAGTVQDMTELKQAEAALRQSQTQLQHIIDTVPEGVLLLDGKGQIRLTNPVGEQHLAILAPDWSDGRFTHLGPRPLSELLTSPPKGLWHEIRHDTYTFEAIARPIENSADNAGWVLVLRDVTQERDIQRRVQQQERLAAVGQLAAGIAHDFNNIMAVITLYAQLILRSAELSPRTQERVDIIEHQAQRAADLVQQILDFSRQSVLERKPLDMLPFLKELSKLLDRTLPEHIQIELDGIADAYIIHADPSRIQQMIMNLAFNARDAMPEGGRLQIRLTNLQIEKGKSPPVPGMPPGKWVQIQLADSGTGIPQKAMAHIFEPFFTTKEKGQGTGLGLAQVYGIVQQHEGYIDVETEWGQGTTFFLYFPALLTGKATAATGDRASLQLGQGQTVLVVEDDPAVRRALVDSLALLNYKVLEAANGREALTILTTKTAYIDLVLSDVVMPEMGGIALLHALRQQALGIPVVLLTGHPLSKEMENLQRLGLAGWLLKPPNLVNLSNLLAQALASSL